MSLSSIDDLLSKKTCDTLVIFGSGPSIKNLTKDDLAVLHSYDTMSFNLFCKTGISVDMYIIGEILNTYYANVEKSDHETLKILKNSGEDDYTYLNYLCNSAYTDTFMILWDTQRLMKRKDCIYEKIIQDKIHLHTKCIGCGTNYIDKNKYNVNYLKKNKTLYHQNVGLNSCIFLGVSMGYKRIIFSGVDLNDYNYAFDRTLFRKKLIREDENTPHRSWKHVFSFLNFLKGTVKFEVYNQDSKLSQIIPVYKHNGGI